MKSRKNEFKRILNLDLPVGQSAFLWGARKTGKSTFLAAHFPHSVRYDLLKSEVHLALLRAPETLRLEVVALPNTALRYPIIIDEVQKIPELLDEVHWLIENTEAYFILCGSSARKIKRMGANLLGGRAWRYHLFPLTIREIPHFDLIHALNVGLIPSHYLSDKPEREIEAYVDDYLKEEIQSESAIRNLPAFTRFLDAMAYSSGELVNYQNIARDCGIDAKTVKAYFHILVDTLLGYFVLPFGKKGGRATLSVTPKFYLFDVGILQFLKKTRINVLKGPDAGHAFEHLVLMELKAFFSYQARRSDIQFWRTATGMEVDFVLENGAVAIEVKLTQNPGSADLKGLNRFLDDYPTSKGYVVCLVDRPRKMTVGSHTVSVLPYMTFIEQLWIGKVV